MDDTGEKGGRDKAGSCLGRQIDEESWGRELGEVMWWSAGGVSVQSDRAAGMAPGPKSDGGGFNSKLWGYNLIYAMETLRWLENGVLTVDYNLARMMGSMRVEIRNTTGNAASDFQIEAVRRVPESLQGPSGQVHPESLRFISRIGDLQIQNDYLSEQLHVLKCQFEAEVRLRSNSEEKLRLAYGRSDNLQKELQAAAHGEAYFRSIKKSLRELKPQNN
ncbi:hypothetical protein FHL15_003062 [Xylaria flabelliformis]|uniref:Uncharacterized protein n=1 Tax=Xylaria flabelliformis TaxID=2512241 RepID=A0A553I6U1_9PEZI|nr:hypothetical protein FHL15_003062 [Xylaria flabelliformis]